MTTKSVRRAALSGAGRLHMNAMFVGNSLLRLVRVVPVRCNVRSAVTSALNKKQITPLIKAIHPDYFMNDDADVKAANLSCVQSLNDLWQTLVALETQLQKRSAGVKEMMISVPFKARYDLSCYVKSTGQANDNSQSLHKVECYIRPHPKICVAGQAISFTLVKYYLHNVLAQLDNLYQDIGLETQFVESGPAEAAPAPGEPAERKAEKDYFAIADQQLEDVRAELEERTINLRERVHAAAITVDVIAEQNVLKSGQPFKQLGKGGPAPFEDRKESAYSLKKARKENEVKYGLFEAELQTFFHSGNVLVKGIEPSKQVACLQKLHKFMSQYGRLLNFRYDRWHRVVFVLAGGAEDFAFELRVGRYIITIPSSFVYKDAAAFIQKSLPMSKLTYGFND